MSCPRRRSEDDEGRSRRQADGDPGNPQPPVGERDSGRSFHPASKPALSKASLRGALKVD
jgi:hypothetical protein